MAIYEIILCVVILLASVLVCAVTLRRAPQFSKR